MNAESCEQTESEPQVEERSAEDFLLENSPAAFNIVSYRFGTSPEATRPDCVMRLPTAALLIQRRGQLYEHYAPGQRFPLPRIALLGPRHQAHIWETAPNTRFTLVNLAPGAAQSLFGVDPRDVLEQTESLAGHSLADALCDPRIERAPDLNARLCRSMNGQAENNWRWRRARKTLMAIKQMQLGPQVRDYADHFGVTPRTLQRIVSNAVGLTTKQVLAVQRIRHMITLTGLGWTRSVADLAQEAGFYDQSHMRYDLQRMGVEKVSQLVEGDHILTQF
ncbi:MAG TPA: helix-turn-helix domain-containing protein [Xanthomonadales bacterium]|nr:helix-turn-helix domain-containing protein [Xanthomonadales bacterium]